jgi:hypothetical protein
LYAVDSGQSVLMRSEVTASVTACSLVDEDGDLATTDDRSPFPEQKVFLRVDGNRQEPAQITQEDGCYTWSDLAPVYNYGLESAASRGWKFLSPAQVDFGPASPGDALRYEFILAAADTDTYLPVVFR